jgi:hypothetical protein
MDLARLALPALGLAATSATAQTHFLAVSEVSGGANGQGEVAIYRQDDSTGGLYQGITTSYATITAQSNLANPMGPAFDATSGTLYVAGLGNNGIVTFDVNTKAINSYAVPAGFHNRGGLAVSGGTLYISA